MKVVRWKAWLWYRDESHFRMRVERATWLMQSRFRELSQMLAQIVRIKLRGLTERGLFPTDFLFYGNNNFKVWPMKPAKTGIARLSSMWGKTVSTKVAIAAIGIIIIQLPIMK